MGLLGTNEKNHEEGNQEREGDPGLLVTKEKTKHRDKQNKNNKGCTKPIKTHKAEVQVASTWCS